MIATETAVSMGDGELVRRTLSGDRDAFGQIVSRYQSLICSLAYSATGSLGQSEDLAQETFIIAWRRLGHLRKHHSLRAWLCGIARNRINETLRREGREPLRDAEPLDAVEEPPAPGPLPHDHAISAEEAALLWRALERIPPVYREPLILYYREQQSVEAVAEHLQLTGDAVRQRLARGRKLLQEQVLAFVEGALTRSKPQKAFTLAVLASLPALTLSAKAAVAGAAVKGGASAKGVGAIGVFGALLGPLIVFLPNYIAYRVSLAGAYSDDERAAIKSLYAKVAAITLSLFIPAAALLVWLTWDYPDRSVLSGLFAGTLVLIFLPTFFALTFALARKDRAYHNRLLEQEYNGVFPEPAWEYRSKASLFGLPLVHIRAGDRFAVLKKPVKAWVAVGHTAIGGLFALGAGAIAPISIGGVSIGLVSLGGVALGGVSLGGIALGVWPVFGALLIGWQAFNGCFVIAWNAAVGLCALAHDHALGSFVHAAQANNDVAREVIFPNPIFRLAEFTHRHWIWLNVFWIGPFFVMWLMARTRRQKPGNV